MVSLVKKKSSEDVDAHKRAKTLSETKNWYQDRYQTVSVQRNLLFIVAVIALVSLAIAVSAVATLNASKTFEPFVIEVEDKTGVVTQIERDTIAKYTADEAIIKYFIVKYIQARESYNVYDYRYFHNQVVRLLSSVTVYRQFARSVSSGNPDSVVNFGGGKVRNVKIKSITFLKSQKIQVRIVLKDRTGGNKVVSEKNYIATIDFVFLPLALTQKQRYINPMGFQVKSYTLDVEEL